MLSVTPGHSAGYLTNQVGAGMESYYTGAVGAGEPPGVWHGKGAAALGLEGEVDADVMSGLYERYLDPTDERFADPQSRYGARTLGRRAKEYRTPDRIVEDRIREYTTEYASTPTPEQVHSWRLQAEKDVSAAAHFYDLTFSPDKSVTVLHAAFVRAGHEAAQAGDADIAARWQWAADQVEEAVLEASAAGLDYVESTACFTRTGRHGSRSTTGKWADGRGITVARFLQHTSRENDPQLHVHQAVLNKVQTNDGKWLALDGKAVHTARPAAASVSERELELALTRRLGIEWETRADGVGRRVVGVDPTLEDLFSSRARAIGPEAEKRLDAFEAMYGRPANNIERTRIIKKVTLATRRGKTHVSESAEEMNARWHAEASAEVAGGLGRQAHQFTHVLTAAPTDDDAAAPAASGQTAAALDAEAAGRQAGGSGRTAAQLLEEGEEFSVRAVLAHALEACHGDDGKATFTRHDLIRQIDLALPANLGDLAPGEATKLLHQLADAAMADPDVVQVAGRDIGHVPDSARLAAGTAETINPSRIQYATRGHLSAEWALLRAAGERGRTAMPRQAVQDWLEAHPLGAALSPAQREALLGLASSDAAAAVLVGPAGTGKSFTAAAFDTAWRDLTAAQGRPGRAVGVAITQAAADVLAEDGVIDSANIAAFLAAQRRLADGRPRPDDARWQLGRDDVLLVDEASMADTRSLNRLQAAVDAAGARVVLMGDPHQLGPVGAGGMMRAAIDRAAETYTLTEVRRFTHAWERDASLRLRDGDPDAVSDYDRHGRVVDAGRENDAVAAIARAAAADRIAGKDVVVITASNEHAAQVAAQVRRHLEHAGAVGPAAVHLGRDGTAAGVGDLVQARRIDRGLGLVNREVYRVDAVHPDGTLDVTSTRTGNPHVVPAGYTEADLSLAYASTAHGAQDRTVDTGHVLLAPGMDRAGAYVGMTRGRESNTAWAITDPGIPNTPVHTGRGLLARALTTEPDPFHLDGDSAAAVDVDAADHAYRRDAGTLLGLIEDETRIATRTRVDTHLDQLVADGALTDTQRARFGAEQGTEHLARLLRAHEQAGHDPATLLRDAVHAGSLDGALALSQVVAARIAKTHSLDAPTTDTDSAPGVAAADDRAEYVAQLRVLLAERSRQLGEDLAARADDGDLPAWIGAVLGPVPSAEVDAASGADTRADGWGAAAVDTYATSDRSTACATGARQEWIDRAGVIAAQREAAGWTHPSIPLGRCPGVSTPEKRAAWHTAYTAAGMPAERRPEAEMTDGRLLVRARAAERALTTAPPSVYDAQRERHRLADTAARDTALANARGDLIEAARLEADAAAHVDAARRLDDVADARARWLLAHAETLSAGEAATAELYRRGLGPGLEPDRTTATEWLAAEAHARAADDAHRTITETDIFDDERDHAARQRLEDVDTHGLGEGTAERAAHDDASAPMQTDHLEHTETHEVAAMPRPDTPRGITQSEHELIHATAKANGIDICIEDIVVADGILPSAVDSAHRPKVARILADLNKHGSKTALHERSQGANDSLSADAAAAEIAAAAAAASKTLDALADHASEELTEPVVEDLDAHSGTRDEADDWELRRTRQIEAEQDAVAGGVWHDEATASLTTDYVADAGVAAHDAYEAPGA